MMTDNLETVNPLLDFTGLPKFDRISPADVSPAIDQLLRETYIALAILTVSEDTATWDNFVVPLEDATEKISRAWSVVEHLHAVLDTPDLRAAYNENEPKIIEFWTLTSQNLLLFKNYKAIRSSADFKNLSSTQRRVVDNALKNFKLSGIELHQAQKVRLSEIRKRCATLATKFSENILDATNGYYLFIENEVEIDGLPYNSRQAARAAAEQDHKPGYKFTLQFPSYYPILKYANNRALREKIYRANVTKASELGDKPQWDNSDNIVEILNLRNEEAKLLGFENYAELSLSTKMCESPDEAIKFLESIGYRARSFAERDLLEMKAFAVERLSLPTLEAWDFLYVAEKLREQRHAFSEQELKRYFPEKGVIESLFRLAENLFEIQVTPDKTSVWHPDVKFFQVRKDGNLVAQFYLDLYARSGKREGAWMDDARSRRYVDGKIQTPVAYLNCNFPKPALGRESFLDHDEVITLFHEFGHGLHHMLSQIDELGVSGISAVEWDAVELPSQFMENFCWEWDTLQSFGLESEGSEKIPYNLFKKVIAAKNFQVGLQTLKQIELSLIDMHLHGECDFYSCQDVQNITNQVRDKISVFKSPCFNRFQHSFSHIFAGGYAAGYYSYKWAEVLSSDAYSVFEEAVSSGDSMVSTKLGKKFCSEILSVGGSRPALESFIAFRGRKPKIDALLRHSGMIVDE
jgi:oligopeptidase A